MSEGANILKASYEDKGFLEILEILGIFKEQKELKPKSLAPGKGHNCFCYSVQELYPELFKDMEAEEIRRVLAYGLYLSEQKQNKKNDEKFFLVQDYKELLTNGIEVDWTVGVAALKGLDEDLHVILNVGEEKILVGANTAGHPKISSSAEISGVVKNDRAKVIELGGTVNIDGTGRSYEPVKNKSVLQEVKGYESAEEALNNAIKNNSSLINSDVVKEILNKCPDKDKDSMRLVLLSGIKAVKEFKPMPKMSNMYNTVNSSVYPQKEIQNYLR